MLYHLYCIHYYSLESFLLSVVFQGLLSCFDQFFHALNIIMYVLGIESSANKIGISILSTPSNILSNRRRTHNAPPGQGFLPKETATHHSSQFTILLAEVLREAAEKEQCTVRQIVLKLDVIAYTKGPGMGACLSVAAVGARMLSKMWGKEIVAVNHCVGRKRGLERKS